MPGRKPESAAGGLRRRDYDETLGRILTAARALVAERGPDALTISEVAHRAGLNRTTAYHHFRTREELVAVVVTELGNELAERLVSASPIEGNLDELMLYLLEHPELPRLWMHQLLQGSPLPNSLAWDRIVEVVRERVEGPGARPAVDGEMLANILLCATFVGPLRLAREIKDPEELREAALRLSSELTRLLEQGALPVLSKT